jgi:hypothetical protein
MRRKSKKVKLMKSFGFSGQTGEERAKEKKRPRAGMLGAFRLWEEIEIERRRDRAVSMLRERCGMFEARRVNAAPDAPDQVAWTPPPAGLLT